MQTKSAIGSIKFFHGFIKFGKVATILFLVGTIIFSFVKPNRMDIPIQFEVPNAGNFQINTTDTTSMLIKEGNGFLRYESEGNTFTSASLINIFYKIISAISGFLLYFLLDKIVQDTRAKKPFNLANAQRMSWIGYLLIFMGALSALNKIIGGVFIDNYFGSNLISLNFNAQIWQNIIQLVLNKSMLLGLFAILVAQILRYGIELREENALTI